MDTLQSTGAIDVSSIIVYLVNYGLAYLICLVSAIVREFINVATKKKRIRIGFVCACCIVAAFIARFIGYKFSLQFDMYASVCAFLGFFSNYIATIFTNDKLLFKIIVKVLKKTNNKVAKYAAEAFEEIAEEDKKDKEAAAAKRKTTKDNTNTEKIIW